MELCRINGIFETEEMADLAAGRIRRNVQGIRRITVRPLGKSVPPAHGRERFTMLPANLRMMNYATDVLYAEIDGSRLPENLKRLNAELTVVCDSVSETRVSAIMQSLGAYHMQHKKR